MTKSSPPLQASCKKVDCQVFLHEFFTWCFAMLFMKKKSTPFCHGLYHGCYEDFYKVVLLVIQAFVLQ